MKPISGKWHKIIIQYLIFPFVKNVQVMCSIYNVIFKFKKIVIQNHVKKSNSPNSTLISSTIRKQDDFWLLFYFYFLLLWFRRML